MDGKVVVDMVDNFDKDCVAFSSIESWAWEAPVDGHNGLRRT